MLSAKPPTGRREDRERAFQARLHLLCNDHTSNSLGLASQALDLAEDWLREGLNPSALAREFATMHPGIALIANLARIFQSDSAALATSIGELRQSLQEGNRRVAERLASLVAAHASVITLSNSATVREALVHVGVRTVYVMESRPAGEGVLMTEELQRHLRKKSPQSTVHLIEPTTIGNLVSRVDCAIVGIDSISQSGGILHKVGTLPLALCCYHFRKPFYALGHSFKRVDHDLGEFGLENDPSKTQLFDYTPAHLITRTITEGGSWWRFGQGAHLDEIQARGEQSRQRKLERYILAREIEVYPLSADAKLMPAIQMATGTELVMPPNPMPDDYPHGPGLSKFLYRGRFYIANTRLLQEALSGWKPQGVTVRRVGAGDV